MARPRKNGPDAPPLRQFPFRLTADQLERVDHAAKLTHLSRTDFVRFALSQATAKLARAPVATDGGTRLVMLRLSEPDLQRLGELAGADGADGRAGRKAGALRAIVLALADKVAARGARASAP